MMSISARRLPLRSRKSRNHCAPNPLTMATTAPSRTGHARSHADGGSCPDMLTGTATVSCTTVTTVSWMPWTTLSVSGWAVIILRVVDCAGLSLGSLAREPGEGLREHLDHPASHRLGTLAVGRDRRP